MAESKKTFSKVMIIVFLVLVVIGFTIPAIFNRTENPPGVNEPKVCQQDSECYLLCEEQPVAVLCSQNLCQRNSCQEQGGYNYSLTPWEFQLEVEINGAKINLTSYVNPQDFFVKFNPPEVQVFTKELSLNQVLDKVQMKLEGQCLKTGQGTFCAEKEKEVRLLVNGTPSYSYGDYVPQAREIVRIDYS